MNIQTYQNCIKTLQNEIKSRENQRQGMQNTIIALDRDLCIEIDRNKTLRDQLMYLAKTNQDIYNELHTLQTVIKEKDEVIESKMAADQGRGLYIEALERDKAAFVEEARHKDLLLSQKNAQFLSTSTQLSNALQAIKGYESNLHQKLTQISHLSNELRVSKEQCALINQKLVNTLKQQQIQRKQFNDKLLQSQGSATSITSKLMQKLHQLQTQLSLAKQFYEDQVATLEFNKQSQVAQLTKQVSSLQLKVSSKDSQITQLKEQQRKLKSHYEMQIENNDKVVNTLINEINFLKEEKVQLKKRSSQKIQETANQVLLMALEMADRQAKTKATENEIRDLKQQVYRRDKEISNLNKQIEKLNFQVQIAMKEHSGQKDTVLKKNEEIGQLKRFIQNLKKFAQVADKEKQTIAKKTSRQIDNLKAENEELTQKLQSTTKELQKLRIATVELQESVKFLSIQKTSTSSNLTQLQTLIKTHEFTIQKLQHMLEQTKKVVVDLNKLMKTKLAQIQSLQMSNNLFRKEKVEWIKKQQDYRRRIAQYKATSSAAKKINLNETSFMSRAAKRSVVINGEKDRSHNRTHSMLLANVNSSDKQTGLTSSVVATNPMRRKTMMPGNFSDNKAKTLASDDCNVGYSQGESDNQSFEGTPVIKLAQNAFRKPQIKAKKKSVDFTELPFETPVIPVLIAMKKQQDKINLSSEGQNSIDKQSGVHEDRVGWEGLSENVIEALALNASPRSPLSDRQSQSNRESIAQIIEYETQGNLGQKQQKPRQLSGMQIGIKAVQQAGLQQGDKQISSQTHPQTPTTIDNPNPQPTIQSRCQSLTPQFHIQSQSPDSINKSSLENQQDPNQGNIVEGYQTLEEYQAEQRMSVSKNISPINSRVMVKQDQLGEILEDEELTEINEVSQLNAFREREDEENQRLEEEDAAQLSNNQADEHDSEQAKNTVDSINILLDRINTQ